VPYRRIGRRVYKVHEDGKIELVPGGEHENAHKAQKHLKALYANVKDAKKK